MKNTIAEIAGIRTIDITDRDLGMLAPGHLRVEVEYAGVCGSDIHFFDQGFATPGTPFGHEIVGRVVKVPKGSDLHEFDGARVTVIPYLHCGECLFCVNGMHVNCSTRKASFAGGFTQYLDVEVGPDRRNIIKVPASIESRVAVLTEPAAVAHRAVRRAREEARIVTTVAPVLVLGAGPIGQLIINELRYRGFNQIWALETNPTRRHMALAQGATRAFAAAQELQDALEQLPNHDPGILGVKSLPPIRMIFECTGNRSIIDAAIERWSGRGSVILQTGLYGTHVSINIDSLLRKDSALVPTYAYSPDDWDAALELLTSRRDQVIKLVTVTQGINSLRKTFTSVTSPRAALKPVIEMM